MTFYSRFVNCYVRDRPSGAIDNVITVLQLSYRVPTKTILRRLDLQVERGRTTAVMGMSGTGKSTLLKCIAGLIPQNQQPLVKPILRSHGFLAI